MTTNLNPYLNFRGRAREALEFYGDVFGGTPTFSTFGEFGMSQDPAEQDQIMHGQLVTSSDFTLMAADVPAAMPFNEGGSISVSLSGGPEDKDELQGYWDKLSDGGNVFVPLELAPWGDWFGMCTDKVGVQWLVNIGGDQSGRSSEA